MDDNNNKKRSATEDADQQPPTKKLNHTTTSYSKESSIFGYRPVDDITKHIAEFIAKYVDRDNVEIEAKLGIFVDKSTGQRMNVGAQTETVLHADDLRYYRFESNMPLDQHKHFNKILNERVTMTAHSNYRGEPVIYKHTLETDRFHNSPASPRTKYRVTTNTKTRQLVRNGIIEKIRLADLNIHSPRQSLDYRISINQEMPRDMPTTAPVYERNKDRISYQHGGIAFDLTQVKTAKDQDPTDPNVRHEMELEFADSKQLLEQKLKQDRNEHSQYTQMVETFVNNIRLLSSKALKLDK